MQKEPAEGSRSNRSVIEEWARTVLIATDKAGRQSGGRNLTYRYSLWLPVGGFSLCLLLLTLNLLQTDDTTTATTALAVTTTTIAKTYGQRSSINQGRSSSSSSCFRKVKKPRICEFRCYDINDDPGGVAGDYVTTYMDTSQCSVAEVYIYRSNFRERKLSKGWFKADVRLTKIHLENCDISLIDDDAFEGLETYLEKLGLIQLDITVLNKNMISNLSLLKELYLNRLHLTQIEHELLSDFEYFETLQMQQDYGLSSMLPNITGKAIYSISIVDFQFNDLRVLKPDFFTGLEECKSLYFSHSSIRYIEPKTFFFPRRIQAQIYLNGNRLKTLSEDALNLDHFEKINLEDNEWRCNCSIAWLARRIREDPRKFEGNITCTYPDYLKGVMLKDVFIEDCSVTSTIPTTDITVTYSPTDESTTTTTTTTTHKITTTEMIPTTKTPIKTTTILTEGTTTLQSSTTEKIQTTTTTTTTTELSSTDNSVPDTTTPFNMICKNIHYTDDTNDQPNETYSIKELREGELEIHVGFYESGWKLFLKIEEDNEVPCWYIDKRGKRGSYKLNLNPGKLYLMCIMATERSETNPSNCVAHSMLPNDELQAWLLNKDAPLVIAGSVVGIVVVSVLIAGVVYATVRHYPTLIKDNKRVILVHHRSSAKFLIMPKGYKGDLPVSKENVRTTSSLPSSSSPASSRRSTTSYVSITEPTAMEMLAWRLQRLKEKLKQSMAENDSEQTNGPPPPPVPPYPKERIHSLSWRVESLNSGYVNTSLA